MRQNNSKNKKRLKIIVALVIIAALCAGGITSAVLISRSRIIVDVRSVSALSTTWWGDNSVTDGLVSTDVSQSIYLSTSEMVDAILVSEGQSVRTGDPLIEYDTTLLALQAEIQELDIELLEGKIKKKQTELDAYKRKYSAIISKVTTLSASGLSFGIGTLAAGSVSPAVFARPLTLETEPTAPVGGLEPADDPQAVSVLDKDSVPYEGEGTFESPYRFFITSGATITGDFIVKYAISEKSLPTYVVIELRKDNLFSGKLYCTWRVIFQPDGNFGFDVKLDEDLAPYVPGVPTPTQPPDPTPSPSPSPTASPTPTAPPDIVDPGGSLTNEEIQMTYNEMQTELKNLKSDLKQLELNYKSTSKKLEEGVVYSTINGVVSGLIEPEQAQIEGTPLMTVAGGDGYLIRGTMSELDFGQIEAGQTVDIMSWMSGTQCQGTITEISNLPAASSYYYGSGNTNVSYYPFTVYVSGEYSLREGEYVEMTLSYESNGADTLYIERAYVRQEDDGRSYVYADKEGRLEKRYINTGKLLWGYYLEIKSGLTAEDLVAFPYGSDVKEGVKTLDVSDSEFGYYPMY